MDLFVVVFILLLIGWGFFYFNRIVCITLKYKVTMINFVITIIIILLLNQITNDVWKISLVQWVLLPNALAGSICPLACLLTYQIIKNIKKK